MRDPAHITAEMESIMQTDADLARVAKYTLGPHTEGERLKAALTRTLDRERAALAEVARLTRQLDEARVQLAAARSRLHERVLQPPLDPL